MGREVV